MPAKCYCCSVSISRTENPSIQDTDPVGCCSNCDTFACHGHGKRDHSVPEFICSLCISPKLVASAITYFHQNSPSDSNYSASLQKALMRFSDSLYKSVEDFENRVPGFEPALAELSYHKIQFDRAYDNINDPNGFNALFESVSPAGQRLLTAAALILHRYFGDYSIENLPDYLQFLLSHLK